MKDPDKRIDMEGLRMHPWVNGDSESGPTRITPRFTGKIDDSILSNTISGICRDDAYTVITIRNPGKQLEDHTNKSDSVFHRRRQSNPFINMSTIRDTVEVSKGLPELPTKDIKKRHPASMKPFKRRTASAPYQQSLNQKKSLSANKILAHHQETATSPVFFSLPNFLTSKVAIIKSVSTVAEEREEQITKTRLIEPPAKSIRTIQISFRKGAVSKSLAPAQLFNDLQDALESMRSSLPYKISFSRIPEHYIFHCIYSHEEGTVVFEAEVGKLWMLQQYGLQTKRVLGNAIVYQNLVSILICNLGW